MKHNLLLLIFLFLTFTGTIFSQVPLSPVLVEPPNITTSVSITPLLSWTSVPTAGTYELQVSTQADFTEFLSLLTTELTTNSTTLPPGVLTSNTKYYWRVRAKNSYGQSDFSTSFWFQTAGTFQQDLTTLTNTIFYLILNNNISYVRGNQLNQKVEQALEKAQQHKFDQAINIMNEFINKVDNFLKLGYISQEYASALLYTANGIIVLLTEGDNINSTGNIQSGSFILEQNYPNPFNPVTVINYFIPEATKVTLKIYDLSGKLVTTLVDENQEPGIHNVMWNASGISSGVYLYKFISGSFIASKKLVLAK